jgi:hypothetical protein
MFRHDRWLLNDSKYATLRNSEGGDLADMIFVPQFEIHPLVPGAAVPDEWMRTP